MGSRSLVGLSLVAMLSSAIPAPASAGVHLIAEIRDLRVQPEPRRAEIWVEGSRVRIDDSWEVAGVTWSTMLYHGDQDVFFGLDQKRRSYVRIDRPTLATIGSGVRMLRAVLDSQMTRLSSEQRATAARMLGSSEISRQPVPPLVTRDTGDREEIDGRDCRLVEVRRAGRSVGMAWVASWGLVALEEDSLRVFRKLANLLGELNGTVNVGGMSTQIFEVFEGFAGFPMRVRWDRNGQPTSDVHFISVLAEETPSQLFELPADYRERGLASQASASIAPTQ